MKNTPVEYIDRATGKRVPESIMGDGALRFAYETLAGRTLWPVLFGSRLISALMGRYYDSPRSKSAIGQLAAIPGCRAEEAEKPLEEYGSFNEFFTRHLRLGARQFGAGLRSPADGRLRLFLEASIDRPFPLKGATKTLREVMGETLSAGQFDIAVFRLAPVDYHRFHFPCDCEVVESVKTIPGKYHSVNPIALLRYPNVYADNERQIVKCRGIGGDFWLIDVGAFGVGTIVQQEQGAWRLEDGTPRKIRSGEEKGYFKFGGSTVILVTAAGAIRWDTDLRNNSGAGLETRVLCGEHLGDFAS